MGNRLPPRAGQAGAGVHAGASCFAWTPDGDAAVRRISRPPSSPPSSCPAALFGTRHDGARWITSSPWRRGGSRRPPNSTSPRSSSRSWRRPSASTSRNTSMRRARQTGKALGSDGDAVATGRRSMRGPSSGATINGRRSRIGRRSPTRATRSTGRQGVNERIMLRELLRRVDMMVTPGEQARRALVRLHTPLPPGKIGGAGEPECTPQNLRLGIDVWTRMPGLTEVLIPAGYVGTTVYDPVFALERGPQALRSNPLRRADHPAGAGTAVLARVPGRTRQGGHAAAQDRVRLRGRLDAPDPAAGVPARSRLRDAQHDRAARRDLLAGAGLALAGVQAGPG